MNKINEDKIQQCMYELFATNYAFYLLVQKYHWNITGNNFYMLHKFLEDIYEESAEDNDKIAECIRAMGYYIPATFQEIIELSKIQDDQSIEVDSAKALNKIYLSCKSLQGVIIAALKTLNNPEQEGAISLLTDILQKKDKISWLIKSHII